MLTDVQWDPSSRPRNFYWAFYGAVFLDAFREVCHHCCHTADAKWVWSLTQKGNISGNIQKYSKHSESQWIGDEFCDEFVNWFTALNRIGGFKYSMEAGFAIWTFQARIMSMMKDLVVTFCRHFCSTSHVLFFISWNHEQVLSSIASAQGRVLHRQQKEKLWQIAGDLVDHWVS